MNAAAPRPIALLLLLLLSCGVVSCRSGKNHRPRTLQEAKDFSEQNDHSWEAFRRTYGPPDDQYEMLSATQFTYRVQAPASFDPTKAGETIAFAIQVEAGKITRIIPIRKENTP